MKRTKQYVFVATLLMALLASGGVASACPLCADANESGVSSTSGKEPANNRPRAYMYSILFMLFVPATMFAGFGIGFYRLSKKRELLAGN